MEENFTEVLECLDGIDSVSERTFNALCPNHDDHNPSLRFRIFDTEEGHKRLTFWCDVCGEDAQEAIREKLGLGWRAFSTEYRGRGAVRTTAVYEYTAADGTLLYKVLRREDGAGDKYFPQYHPDPAGGEDLPGPGPVKVPFNLPGVQRAVARGDLVINVEGEKDALNGERHLGYCFTTSSGGAKNFSSELVPHFVNADLVFIPDNDAAGRAHVLEAANMVLPVAKRVPLLDLPVTGQREGLSD